MMKVYFVVLHYINIQDTLNCIDSINLIKGEKEIIIVDNGSSNGTGEELIRRYSKDDEVRIILSNDNLGFARGNNLGISQIDDKQDSIVVVCNSDVLFEQDDICSKIIDLYRKTGFAVLGPDITSQDRIVHENPTICEISDTLSLKKQIRRFQFENTLNTMGLTSLSRAFNKILNKKTMKLDYRKAWCSRDYNIKLHGSCLVFSPLFFESYNGFFDGTFLFQEENILSDMCRRTGLLMTYSPDISVIHLGSRSYKKKYKNGNARFKNYVGNCLLSLKKYKIFIEEHKEKQE